MSIHFIFGIRLCFGRANDSYLVYSSYEKLVGICLIYIHICKADANYFKKQISAHIYVRGT